MAYVPKQGGSGLEAIYVTPSYLHSNNGGIAMAKHCPRHRLDG
jgi:hypothetical protein